MKGIALILALAVATSTASAQVRDSTARADTSVVPIAAADSVPKDTIKAPLAQAPLPSFRDAGGTWRWEREDIFRSGATTLAELLDVIPGYVTYSASAIAPAVGNYLGSFGRVRVFVDGLEIDPIDSRMGGMLDLSFIQLWLLETVVVERAAGELRVHLRTWTDRRTSADTRIDVATGDLKTNSFRGYYAKRFKHGEALQIGAQQWSMDDQRTIDGDVVTVFGRAGWASGNWKFDAMLARSRRQASGQERSDEEDTRPVLTPQQLRETQTYARFGYGDPDVGSWLQLMAGRFELEETSPKRPGGAVDGLPRDSVDTTAVRTQFVLSGGSRRGGLHGDGALRLRRVEGKQYLSPSVRLGYDRGWLSASVYGEQAVDDSLQRIDGALTVRPFDFLALGIAASRSSSTESTDPRPTSLAVRAEAGLRLGRTWLTGGVIRLDTTRTLAPTVFDTGYVDFAGGERTGIFGGIRGKFWRDVGLDITATRWNDEDEAYLPQYVVQSKLYLDTWWLSRFPTHNFRILAAVQHEYRTEAAFPIAGAALQTDQYRWWGTLLELRLYDAAIWWQFRNLQNGPFIRIPGFEMPPATNFYGIRWSFIN